MSLCVCVLISVSSQQETRGEVSDISLLWSFSTCDWHWSTIKLQLLLGLKLIKLCLASRKHEHDSTPTVPTNNSPIRRPVGLVRMLLSRITDLAVKVCVVLVVSIHAFPGNQSCQCDALGLTAIETECYFWRESKRTVPSSSSAEVQIIVSLTDSGLLHQPSFGFLMNHLLKHTIHNSWGGDWLYIVPHQH